MPTWQINDAGAEIEINSSTGPNSSSYEINDASYVGPPAVTITVSVEETFTEEELTTGGETLILTATGDTWVAAGATFNAQRQAIINGLNSAQYAATGWNNEVRDKEVVGAVVRTSDTVVTITLTAAPAFDIAADEWVTVTVPAAALVIAASDVIAYPLIQVEQYTAGGGDSMTLRQMRNLERRQLLAMLREDDEVIIALVADMLRRR